MPISNERARARALAVVIAVDVCVFVCVCASLSLSGIPRGGCGSRSRDRGPQKQAAQRYCRSSSRRRLTSARTRPAPAKHVCAREREVHVSE